MLEDEETDFEGKATNEINAKSSTVQK